MLTAGCASWQGPRIDPSGESLFIWPNQVPPAIVGPPAGAPVVTSPTVAPPAAVIAPPPGNVQAAPVYSDVPAVPLAPAPATGGIWNPFTPTLVGPPVITTPAPPAGIAPVVPNTPPPAVPALTPGLVTSLGAIIPVGQDYLRVLPDRILAPVGTEVVLKAGICSAAGYLLTDQRVEWLLARDGAGQFVDLGERDQLDLFRWPWDTPRKVDNWYAIGSTAYAPVCLNRGTADPNDDVQILSGDAWITVTSSTEGTSHVTAYTPAISDWNLRRAAATIYWVDAQWVFPPSAVVEPGRPHVLTTTVVRRTDGAPLAGWLVRYDVTGGASLGYGGGNFVEVPTDAAGRASVEVSPTEAGGGTTNVGVTIVRPPLAGPDASPRLEIGRGSATITWGRGATPAPAVPAPISPAPPASTTPPFQPIPPPSLPPSTPPADRNTPPRDEPPPGQARLDVQLRNTRPEQLAVGEFARFEVTVTNRGDGTARGIEILDRFDSGLRHDKAQPNEFAVKYPGMRDLPPGESATIPLTFRVIAGGTHCHEVTITAEGGATASARGCITARQAALEATVTGPRTRAVGETAEFSAVVKNVGDVAATNIELVARCDPALSPTQAEPGHQRLADGGIVLRIDRLEAGERWTFRMEAQCVSSSNRACNTVNVTADGGVIARAEACVEILPPRPTVGPGGAAATPAASNLRLSVTETQNPTRAGERLIVYVNVVNAGQQVERQVAVRVLLPQEMTPDTGQIQPAGQATLLGQEVSFTAVSELSPQGQLKYVIPVSANRAGSVVIRAAVTATGLESPIVVDSNVIEILSSSP